MAKQSIAVSIMEQAVPGSLLLFRLVVERKALGYRLVKRIHNVDVNRLLVCAERLVIEPEGFARQRVEVIGQQHRAVSRRSSPLPVGWK